MALHKTMGVALLAVLLGGAVVSGCGEDEPTVNSPPYPDELAFCDGVAKAICNETVVEACYQSTGETIDDDRDTCIETYTQPSRCNPLSLVYNSGSSIPCVEAYKRAYEDGRLNVAELQDIADSCRAALAGTGELGSSCTVDSDCNGSEGLQCVAKPGQPGSCQEPTSVTAGNSCAEESAICVEGFYCGSDNACIVRPAVDESCEPTRPCVEDALCVGSTCVAKSANGEDCNDDEQCLGGLCVLVKGTPDGTCGAQVILSPTAGDFCTPLLP